MKIAHFQRDLPPEHWGGVARQVHLLANGQSSAGHSVTVFTLSARPPDAGYAVKTLPLPAPLRRSRFFRRFGLGLLFSRVDTSGFDLVHSHGDNYLMFGRRPQVRTFYGSALQEAFSARRPGRFFSQLAFWILEISGTFAADLCVGISPATRKYLPDLHTVVPCAVDPSVFKPGEKEKSAAPSILFVGGLRDRKRGDRMLEIFSSLRRDIPQAELWIVGPDACAGEGVRHYSGISTPDLAGLFRRAWVFCSLSRYEGFGLPLAEAMASGTPVVSLPHGGAEFVLDGGRAGLLTPETRVGDSLRSLLMDPEGRKALAAAGLERAQAFSVDKMIERYFGLYHTLTGKT